jgi:hypothetical protein
LAERAGGADGRALSSEAVAKMLYASGVTLRFPAVSKPPLDRGFWLRCSTAAALLLLVGSCARRTNHNAAAPKSPASAPASSPPVASGGTSFVVEDCPDAKKMDSKAAEAAMRKLTEPCNAVSAPSAEFLATLVPGGRIEIASRDKDAEGVVPICVVKNRLTHSVALKQRCTFVVKLEPPSSLPPAVSSTGFPAP